MDMVMSILTHIKNIMSDRVPSTEYRVPIKVYCALSGNLSATMVIVGLALGMIVALFTV